jgi:hypothetical protein
MAGALVTTNILQTVVSMGLSALRERVVLARIANREREGEITGMRKNGTVNIMVPAAVAAAAVTPNVVPAAVTAVTPTVKALTLSEWYYAPFIMDDKGLAQVQRDVIPSQLTEAVKSIVNQIETYLWGLVHGAGGFYGYVGTAGTTPFSTGLDEFTAANRLADNQLIPTDPDRRYVVLNTEAKANALLLRAVQDASWRGSPEAFRTGEIGQVLGHRWDFSQHVPSHTAGTASGATTDNAGYAVGVKTVTLASAGTGTIVVGDIFTIAGDSQTYVATSAESDVSNGGTLSFEPGLQVAITTATTAITLKATHRCNLLMHGDGLAFAMAPLVEDVAVEGLPRAQAVAIDNDSGLALRLRITEQHYQTQWALDALWGGVVVRQGFGVRIAG